MPEFCLDCPLRGDCDGQLTEVLTVPVPHTVWRRLRFVEEYSPVSMVIDEENNFSEPFRTQPNANVMDLVERCPGVQDKTRRYRPHESYQVCGGLGVEAGLNKAAEDYLSREVEEGIGIHAIDALLAEAELGKVERIKKYLLPPAVGSWVAALVGLKINNGDLVAGGLGGLGATTITAISVLSRAFFAKIPRERKID